MDDIADQRDWPETAEELMRSRFNAFRDGDADWLLRSWHPDTRPASIDLTNNPRWRGLQILGITAGGLADETGTVEFRATFLLPDGGVDYQQENSRFSRVAGRWHYYGEA